MEIIDVSFWVIGDLDGYEQSEKLLEETGDGAIWHTNRDLIPSQKEDDHVPRTVFDAIPQVRAAIGLFSDRLPEAQR